MKFLKLVTSAAAASALLAACGGGDSVSEGPSFDTSGAPGSLVATPTALTTLTPGRLLILNDSFGALSCALQRYRPTAVSDSFLAQEACRRNLASNDFDADSVCQFDALVFSPAPPTVPYWK